MQFGAWRYLLLYHHSLDYRKYTGTQNKTNLILNDSVITTSIVELTFTDVICQPTQ